MQKRKSLTGSRIKWIFCIATFFLFVMCTTNRSHNARYEEEALDSLSFHAPFIAVNVLFKDSVYRIVMEENQARLLPKNLLSGKKYRCDIFPILRNDTLVIDSITFCQLEEKGMVLAPYMKIDTIYHGEIENVLSSFFNEYGVLADTLSRIEQAHLIYVLFQHGIYLQVDCETGLLYIAN